KLPRLRLRGKLVDVQAHIARTGERNEPSLRMRHKEVSDSAAAARQETEALRWKTCLKQCLRENRADGRRLARRLNNHGVAGDQGSDCHAAKNRQREVPG